MIIRTNQECIEFLKEEIERGEYSLGTHMDIFARLKVQFPKLAEEFNTAYQQYGDSDIEVPPSLVERVIEAMHKVPEVEQPKPLRL